jgi:Holliday junction resolvasome RuvABC DNA-binding subunit
MDTPLRRLKRTSGRAGEALDTEEVMRVPIVGRKSAARLATKLHQLQRSAHAARESTPQGIR